VLYFIPPKLLTITAVRWKREAVWCYLSYSRSPCSTIWRFFHFYFI